MVVATLVLLALQGCASVGHPERRPLFFSHLDEPHASDFVHFKVPDWHGSVEILGSSRHISESVYELYIQIGVYEPDSDGSTSPELDPGQVALTMGNVEPDTTFSGRVHLKGAMPYNSLTGHQFRFSRQALEPALERSPTLEGVLELSRYMRIDNREIDLPSIRVVDPLLFATGSCE
jgi:hypothetical protein